MQGYFARLGAFGCASSALAGFMMVSPAHAGISTAARCGITSKPSAPPVVQTVKSAPAPAPTYTESNPCCKQWDCRQLKCAAAEIKSKTDCLLKSVGCAGRRYKCLYDQLVCLNTEVCKLSRCECLSDCEIEKIVCCIQQKVCEVERTVQSSCNKQWICQVKEIKCLVERLNECKRSCEPAPCQNGDTGAA